MTDRRSSEVRDAVAQERRRDDALRRALAMPPKKHKDESKPSPKPPRARSKGER